ncbi:DUF4179 domain-containing protein [Neobacillus kokaensis]|uniref:DUF4179 domain-containing protein n=1 Tax=Neobacillus kokaensis TaxID=2759023 RepID=A0ABQ3NB55_9BACI|nr:DUF4179 domain-containing protein [Neobacillus kokaensis]GHI01143.1 hypothetical protein AM1BK_46850 [Neobacillus kokaensis]
MEKKLFHEQFEEIDVPKEEVRNAIRGGIKRANSGSKYRRNRAIAISAVAAASIFISSSFIFPSFSKVMADMPVVGYFYRDLVGETLETQKLITKLNETASYKGIDVAITSAYYDGAVIGVTFDVKGKVKTAEDGRAMGFYEIFNGDENLGETKEIVYMEPTEKGFTGKIQLSYPKTELPADTTFPLEFKSIGEKEGSWRFNVPIKQLPFETKPVNQVSTYEDTKLQLDSIFIGKASTAINYTVTVPNGERHDDIRFDFFDDHGKMIQWLSDATLEKKKSGSEMIVKGRTIIPLALKDKTKFIEVHPAVALSEPFQFVSLNEKTRTTIKAARQNQSVTINKISFADKKFTVDFQVNNGDKMGMYYMFYHDFARTGVTLVKDSRKNIYEKPIKHKIKTLDKKQLRFRSTFDISGLKNFDPEKYVLRVDLNSMAINMPHEMEPIKVNLE